MATKTESEGTRPVLRTPAASSPEPARQATGTVADRVSRVPTSPTLRISAKAAAMMAEGIDVIDLSVGEPDFPTPEHIKDAGKRAIDENITKYTPNTGVPELRRAIVKRLRDDHGLDYDLDEIIVSPGAKNCLYNLCTALLNRTPLRVHGPRPGDPCNKHPRQYRHDDP